MKRSYKKLQDSFIKFHGCGVYRKDGTNVLVTNKRPCFNPINDCFWMKIEDTTNKVRTRKTEHNENIFISNYLKSQYRTELSTKHESYSTDSDSDSDTDADSKSNKLTNDESK